MRSLADNACGSIGHTHLTLVSLPHSAAVEMSLNAFVEADQERASPQRTSKNNAGFFPTKKF